MRFLSSRSHQQRIPRYACILYTIQDVKEFVGNERIQDDDIIRLFMKMGTTSADPKLTYLSYLNLLKPHFDN